MLDITAGSRALAIRSQLALDDMRARLEDAAAGPLPGAPRSGTRGRAGLLARARALREDGERGAQAAEYAMLGGVSAAACTVLVQVINQNHDVFSSLLSTVLGVLGRAVRAWF